jgi:hypothetical protein
MSLLTFVTNNKLVVCHKKIGVNRDRYYTAESDPKGLAKPVPGELPASIDEVVVDQDHEHLLVSDLPVEKP